MTKSIIVLGLGAIGSATAQHHQICTHQEDRLLRSREPRPVLCLTGPDSAIRELESGFKRAEAFVYQQQNPFDKPLIGDPTCQLEGQSEAKE